MSNKIRIAGIQYDSIVDGPGLRTAIYTQGCNHRCKGCHNPETHDFNGGVKYSVNELFNLITDNSINKNVTFSGGDPVYQYKELLPLIDELFYNGYNLLLYTGFTVSELLNMISSKFEYEDFDKFMLKFDMVISERYIQELDSREIKYRGSTNQLIGRFVYDKFDHIVYSNIPETDIK